MSEKSGLISEAVKSLPVEKVYDEMAGPTVRETGKLIAKIPRSINALLLPFEGWILGKEHELNKLNKVLEMKLEAIDSNKITSPEPYIAVPTIQALFYCIDNDELRELFASLLANAMNSDHMHKVHPSFVEIIKQLSPFDAIMIKKGQYLQGYRPILRIFECDSIIDDDQAMIDAGMLEFCTSNLKKPVFSHYSKQIEGVGQDFQARSIAIFNLHRLGLINTDYKERIILPNEYKAIYTELIESDFYKLHMDIACKNGNFLRLTRGFTSPTEFGRLFYEVCCS